MDTDSKNDFVDVQTSDFHILEETPTISENDERKIYKPFIYQCLAMLAIFIINIPNGLTGGQTATMLPEIESPNSTFHFDVSTGSWIVSINFLSTVLGSMIGGWLMEIWGRKWTHIVSAFVFAAGFVLIGAAQSLAVILIGRFISGLTVGVLSAVGPAYVAEICSPNNRSVFIPSLNLSNAIGILVVHVFGINYNWRITSYFCAVVPLLPVVIFAFVKESPSWLLKQGRIQEGSAAFYWYRGKGQDEQKELEQILKSIQDSNEMNQSVEEKLRYFKEPEVWKPTLVTTLFFMTSQASGFNALISYAQQMIGSTIGPGISEFASMFAIDFLRLVTAGLSCASVRFVNRRPLAFWGLAITIVSLFGLSAFVYESDNFGSSSRMAWIPLILMIIYVSVASLTIVPLPYTLCGEVFPTQVRGPCSGISSAIGLFGSFIVTKTAPSMFVSIGYSGTYFVYAVVTMVGATLLYFSLPETRGKTLISIEEEYKTKYSRHERMNS